jgi:hypothetical protein
LFFVPLNLIQVQHYSATAAGAALLPLVALLAGLSRASTRLVDRFGARLPLVVGPVIAACGFALFAVPGADGTYWTTFFPPMVVLGLGLAITVAPLTATVMNALDAAYAGAASGINNAASRAAGLLAIAVFGLVMVPIFEQTLHQRLDGAVLPPVVSETLHAQRSKLAAIQLPPDTDAATRHVVERAVADAFIAGFRCIMLLSAGLAIAGAGAAWWMIGSRSGASESR